MATSNPSATGDRIISKDNKSRPSMIHPLLAIALKYEQDQRDAPKVVASGKGRQAERILEKAKENQVKTHRDDELALALSHLQAGDEIPVELYEAVAKVLAFLYRADRQKSL